MLIRNYEGFVAAFHIVWNWSVLILSWIRSLLYTLMGSASTWFPTTKGHRGPVFASVAHQLWSDVSINLRSSNLNRPDELRGKPAVHPLEKVWVCNLSTRCRHISHTVPSPHWPCMCLCLPHFPKALHSCFGLSRDLSRLNEASLNWCLTSCQSE